jgi:hypothetical protein
VIGRSSRCFTTGGQEAARPFRRSFGSPARAARPSPRAADARGRAGPR